MSVEDHLRPGRGEPRPVPAPGRDPAQGVTVIGSAGPLARCVVAALAERSDADHPVVDATGDIARERRRGRGGAAASDRPATRTLVHVGTEPRPGTDGTAQFAVAQRRFVEALGALGDDAHVVVVSTAAVYGAAADNPVPLTEDHPVRPVATSAHALHHLALEDSARAWAAGSPRRTATVLRPAVTLAADGASWLARALAGAAGIGIGGAEPPAQFVHAEDVAAAVALVVADRLGGTFNVAPDGWLPNALVRALDGAPPRLHLPPRMAERLARWSWQFRSGPIPPGLLPYTQFPWVVASDRLTAAGWRARWSNEEAYVAGTEGRWWTQVSPKRRQELALGTVGVLVAAAVVAGIVTGVRIRRRHRR
jgi:nucleoside-diphosphate-sugar epimerase